jgi:hypothetical protein
VVGLCSTNRLKRNACRLLVGKPEGKRPLGRSRRRWVDSVKFDFGDWIGLAQDKENWKALVNAIINLPVSRIIGKLSNGYTTGGLSSSTQLYSQTIF